MVNKLVAVAVAVAVTGAIVAQKADVEQDSGKTKKAIISNLHIYEYSNYSVLCVDRKSVV